MGPIHGYFDQDEIDAMARASTQAAPALQVGAGEREPWLPYLSDRADGVKGHYAIARWNPAGYREVWNLRSHGWGAFSDDVLTLDEARKLLQQVSIPTDRAARGAAAVQVGAGDEHYDELRATLRGLHTLCENVSAQERRIGPLGSHARGYTHKISAALRHLDKLADRAAPVAAAVQAPAAGQQAGGDAWHAALWRAIRPYLHIDDVGDEDVRYGLVCRKDDLEIDAMRAASRRHDGVTVESAVAALAATPAPERRADVLRLAYELDAVARMEARQGPVAGERSAAKILEEIRCAVATPAPEAEPDGYCRHHECECAPEAMAGCVYWRAAPAATSERLPACGWKDCPHGLSCVHPTVPAAPAAVRVPSEGDLEVAVRSALYEAIEWGLARDRDTETELSIESAADRFARPMFAAPQANQADAAAYLQPDDKAALERFAETCEDGQPYDVPKDRMLRLSELGAVARSTGARFFITSFGSLCLGSEFARLPLETTEECNARLVAEHSARLADAAREGGETA